jgi:uncharacterized protein with PQ loop repeat
VTLANAAVILATILAWWSLIPQIRKLMRTGDPAGVSSTWPAIGLVANTGWTAYLLSQQLWAAAPSTAVMVLFYIVVLRTLHKAGAPMRVPTLRGVASAVILLAAYLGGSWAVLGLVLGWAYIPQVAPAVWTAYRTANPSGISAGTWSMILVEGVLWLVYGTVLGDTPVIIYAMASTVSAALILLRVATTVGFRPRTA